MTKVQREPERRHPQPLDKKPYEPPAVVYQAQLEVQAGSPVGDDDPLGLDSLLDQ